jgi:ribosomal-protein-alanine N-acetyltransferase
MTCALAELAGLRLCLLEESLSGECAEHHAESFAFPWPGSDFAQLLAAPETLGTGVIDTDGHLAGFVLSRIAADEAEILTVAVAASKRGGGIGTALLGAHLDALLSAGVARVFLEVDPANTAACALYARLGFNKVGERIGYYRTGSASRASALILRADLADGALFARQIERLQPALADLTQDS